jgi:hypothetical protein
MVCDLAAIYLSFMSPRADYSFIVVQYQFRLKALNGELNGVRKSSW